MRTGQVPTLRQAAASSPRPSGGSMSGTNPPPSPPALRRVHERDEPTLAHSEDRMRRGHRAENGLVATEWRPCLDGGTIRDAQGEAEQTLRDPDRGGLDLHLETLLLANQDTYD